VKAQGFVCQTPRKEKVLFGLENDMSHHPVKTHSNVKDYRQAV
jgi:hypothetical protein